MMAATHRSNSYDNTGNDVIFQAEFVGLIVINRKDLPLSNVIKFTVAVSWSDQS